MKLLIVVEDDSTSETGFSLALAGDTHRIGKINDGELSPAEYIGSYLFKICVNALSDSLIDLENIKTGETNNELH